MHKPLTSVALLCVFGLLGCTSDVEKCVQAGLKQDSFYNLHSNDQSKLVIEYKYRMSCLHGLKD
jgi:hypothetical protein